MSTTPILDLSEPPPKPSSPAKWVVLLIGVPSGLFFGLSAAISPRYFEGVNGLLLLPALYVAVAVHELGHLLAGSIVGMPPGGLVIGGITVLKSGMRWLIRFDHRRIFGGGLAMVLPDKDTSRRVPFAWMVAGGPIASIVFVFGCGVLRSKYGNGTWGWSATIFWVAVLMAVLALIPKSSSGVNKSDGARLWTLLRDPEGARAWMALLALQTEVTQGVLPRDWDPRVVGQMLATSRLSSGYAYVQLLVFYRCLDQKNHEGAFSCLENALRESARSGRVIRQCIFLEAAWASASLRGNIQQARVWIERAGKLREPLSADSVGAAIAFQERRYDDALRFLASTRARIERLRLDSGLARFAKQQLMAQEEECLRSAPTPNV